MRRRARTDGIYLIHLDPPYKHAGHYLGWSADIPRRICEHGAAGSKASPLLKAAIAAGSRLRVTRIWLGASRDDERRLKNAHGLSRFCPTCRAAGTYHR